jgi:hypothetical protein
MASGSVYPDSDLVAGWPTSPGGAIYQVVGAGVLNWYAFAWANGQLFQCGFTLPTPPTGEGYTAVSLSWSASNVVVGSLVAGSGATLASGTAPSGVTTWTPSHPLTVNEYNVFAPRLQITYAGSSVPEGQAGVTMGAGAVVVGWSTATLPTQIYPQQLML